MGIKEQDEHDVGSNKSKQKPKVYSDWPYQPSDIDFEPCRSASSSEAVQSSVSPSPIDGASGGDVNASPRETDSKGSSDCAHAKVDAEDASCFHDDSSSLVEKCSSSFDDEHKGGTEDIKNQELDKKNNFQSPESSALDTEVLFSLHGTGPEVELRAFRALECINTLKFPLLSPNNLPPEPLSLENSPEDALFKTSIFKEWEGDALPDAQWPPFEGSVIQRSLIEVVDELDKLFEQEHSSSQLARTATTSCHLRNHHPSERLPNPTNSIPSAQNADVPVHKEEDLTFGSNSTTSLSDVQPQQHALLSYPGSRRGLYESPSSHNISSQTAPTSVETDMMHTGPQQPLADINKNGRLADRDAQPTSFFEGSEDFLGATTTDDIFAHTDARIPPENQIATSMIERIPNLEFVLSPSLTLRN